MTPRTRDEIALRDAVRKALSEVETLVADFVAEKKSERLSDADIDELFVVELPLQLGTGMTVAGSGCRTRLPSWIVTGSVATSMTDF